METENVRLSLEIPKDLHKELKLYAVQNETNIRAVIIAQLEKLLRGK